MAIYSLPFQGGVRLEKREGVHPVTSVKLFNELADMYAEALCLMGE